MADWNGHRCPYLGLHDDPFTWYAFPAATNKCHRPARPLPIPLDHQQARCLASDYADCPVYQLGIEQKGPLSTDKAVRLLANRRRKIVISSWPVVASILVLVVVAGFAVAFLRNSAFKPLASLVSSTQTSTPSPTVSATATSTTLPTDTPPPTLTSTPSLSPTPIPLEVTVAFDSNLREQPIIGSVIITRLLSGTKVVVLGHDRSLQWVFIKLVDDRRGWLALTQISEIIDISSIPFINTALTETPTLQP